MYCQALSEFGYTLIVLPTEEQYPDSVFVEDPAVVINDMLVVARLQDPMRRGEEERVERALTPYFAEDRIFRIEHPGFLEGGDVLVIDEQLFVGISKQRTNRAGARQLAKIAEDCFGYETTFIPLPESLLHLKSGVTYHAPSATTPGVITVTEELAPYFSDVPHPSLSLRREEQVGANYGASGIADDGRVLLHAGRYRTRVALERLGYTVRELGLSEFEKIDGAMTCLSKFFVVV